MPSVPADQVNAIELTTQLTAAYRIQHRLLGQSVAPGEVWARNGEPGDLPSAYRPVDLTSVFGSGSHMVQLACVECFELGRGERNQGGVESARTVEVLDVAGDRYVEFHGRSPGLDVEQFGLRPSPEGLDEGIAGAIADGCHAHS